MSKTDNMTILIIVIRFYNFQEAFAGIEPILHFIAIKPANVIPIGLPSAIPKKFLNPLVQA
jgi:hypothetical protein